MSHQSGGRQRCVPAKIPAARASAAHSMGQRGGRRGGCRGEGAGALEATKSYLKGESPAAPRGRFRKLPHELDHRFHVESLRKQVQKGDRLHVVAGF